MGIPDDCDLRAGGEIVQPLLEVRQLIAEDDLRMFLVAYGTFQRRGELEGDVLSGAPAMLRTTSSITRR